MLPSSLCAIAASLLLFPGSTQAIVLPRAFSGLVSTPKAIALDFAQEARAWASAKKDRVQNLPKTKTPHVPDGVAGGGYPGLGGLKYAFIFGDSYTQTGFNLTNGSPLPQPGNPLGNPPYPGWTSSNGPNWVGYLTTTFNKSELLTFNFAYGGATIDSALVKPWRDDVLSLKDQVNNLFLGALQPRAPQIAPWKARNSLFLIWIGVNDIGNSYSSMAGQWDTFYDKLMDVYFTLVEQLYSAGARNFVFVDVPPIELSPGTLVWGPDAVALERGALDVFNAKLAARVKELKEERGVWAKVFSSSAVFSKILADPKPYDIANTTQYCEAYQNGTPQWDTYDPKCGVPVDQYFWLNSLHPGHRVHRETAKVLASQL